MWQRKELRTLSSVLSGRVRSQGDQKPAITIHPKSNRWEDRVAARDYTNSQLEVWDFISGRLRPELGGRPEHLDIVGVNYYAHNQWIDGGTWIEVDHPRYCPLHHILRNIYARYGRPMFIAETGIEARERPLWLRFLAGELAQARALGVPIEGICWYPITDYPGWLDDRHCPAGLLGYVEADGTRPVYEPLAEEILSQSTSFQLSRPLRRASRVNASSAQADKR
jgi:hypothetical protein